MTLCISLKELPIGIASAYTTSDNHFRRFNKLSRITILPLNSINDQNTLRITSILVTKRCYSCGVIRGFHIKLLEQL